MVNLNKRLLYIVLFSLSILIGILIGKITEKIDFKEILNDLKNFFNPISKILILVFAVFLICSSINLISVIKDNFKYLIHNDAEFVTQSKKISDNAELKIEDDKKYIYIDTEQTGYSYFFELRYLLSPRESIHYSSYVYIINYTDVNQIYDFLQKTDVDYFIIRDCPILEEYFKTDYNDEIGSIYKKNMKSTSIDDLFIEVD